MKRLIGIVLIVIVIGALALLLVNRFAPETTTIEPSDSTGTADCLRNPAGECLVLPAVSGVDILSQDVAFPQAFRAPYTLVVMPFDQNQQVQALEWLEPFQAIAADYDALSYYSIAALPDLPAAVRLMVVGSMNMGLQDEEARQQAAVLFLEDQQALLAALEVDDIDDMRLFLLDAEGTVYWRGRGAYNETTEADLREAVAELLG